MMVSGIIHVHTYVCILYLSCEDAIIAILCINLLIITTTAGEWLKS